MQYEAFGIEYRSMFGLVPQRWSHQYVRLQDRYFSMLHTMIQLSALSRITSYSISFQPATERSARDLVNW